MPSNAFLDLDLLVKECCKEKTSYFIESLGLVPDKAEFVKQGHIPTFKKHPMVQNLYDATIKSVAELVKKYGGCPKRLQDEMAWFRMRDQISRPVLEEHGRKVWGSTARKHLRQAAQDPSKNYPKDLYIDVAEDRERLQIFLSCWIANRAIRRIRKDMHDAKKARQVDGTPKSNNVAPAQPSTPAHAIANGNTTSHANPSTTRAARQPIATIITSSSSSRHVPLSPSPSTPSRSKFQESQDALEVRSPSGQRPSELTTPHIAMPTTPSTTDSRRSPSDLAETLEHDSSSDYDPNKSSKSQGKRKRRDRVSKADTASKLPRLDINAVVHDTNAHLAPDSPQDSVIAHQEPVIAFLERENETATISATSPVTQIIDTAAIGTNGTGSSSLRPQSESPPTENEVSSRDSSPTTLEVSRLELLKMDLMTALLSLFGPSEQNAPADYIKVVTLIRQVSRPNVSALRAKFPNAPHSFRKWVKMLEIVDEFRRRVKFSGTPADWMSYCGSLDSKSEWLGAMHSITELKRRAREVRLVDDSLDLASFSGDLAPILIELTGMNEWIEEAKLVDALAEFNVGLVAWFR